MQQDYDVYALYSASVAFSADSFLRIQVISIILTILSIHW